MDGMNSGARAVADVTSLGIFLSALLGYLPAIAAGFSIVYYCVLFYQCKAVQRWVKRRRLLASIRRRAERNQLRLERPF